MWWLLVLLWIVGDVAFYFYTKAHPDEYGPVLTKGAAELPGLVRSLELVGIGTGLFIFCLALIVFAVSRWRRPRVFISSTTNALPWGTSVKWCFWGTLSP